MSHTIPLEQAAQKLAELIHSLGASDEIVLTENDVPVASLRSRVARRPRHAGNCKGMLTVVTEDTGHLMDFREYMP